MRDETTGEQHTKELGNWKDWDEFLELQTNTGFGQSSWYMAFRVARGWKHFGTVLRDIGTIVGGAMVLTRSFAPEKCYYYIPDGPVLREGASTAEQEQIFHTIMQFIEGKRRSEQQVVSHLCINPRWEHVPSFLRGFRESSYYYGLPRETQCIDLNPSESAILAQMKAKGRYNVGVAQRHGVSVVEDVSPQGIEDFITIYEGTFARKGRHRHGPKYFHTLIPILLASECGSIFLQSTKVRGWQQHL